MVIETIERNKKEKLNNSMKQIIVLLILISGTLFSQIYTPELDSAYKLLHKQDYKGSIPLFESHIKQYPQDTKVWMQLAYIYDHVEQYSKSYQYFDHVSKNSQDPKEKEQAEISAAVMKDKMNRYSKRTIDFDVQSYYDSYQKNYITGLQAYYKFMLSKEVYVGPYLEVYTDSKSEPGNILNDRYIELGLFGRFYALSTPVLYFELRTGYVHEFDFDTSKISVSPRVVFGTRIGEGLNYISANAKKKTGIFMDIFTVASYETKYKNGFSQTGITEAFRSNIKGYSYIDFFAVQYLTLDTRRLDYNNNIEIGAGIKYKPNLIYFPTFFVQPTYKFYLIKDSQGNKRKGTFQIKAGISFGVSIKG